MDSFVYPSEILSLNEQTQLGRNLLPYFQFEVGLTNLNHGSYGGPPRVVSQALRHYEDRMERSPDSWFRFEITPQINRVMDELRKFVGVNDGPTEGRGVGDLVLVRNATFAINSIFRAWPWSRGDKLLYLSEAYEMVKLAAKFVHDTLGVEMVEIPVKFPMSDNALLDLVGQSLTTHGSAVKMVVFSHITSVPAVILPVLRLIDLCRSRNICSVIDGAHALGQIDVDMTNLDPDFYLSNGHKWFMTAKGAAFLYAKRKWRDRLHPAVITYGYGDSDPRVEFLWSGTADYSAYFTFTTALKFRNLLGERRIKDHCRQLALDGGRLMAQIWGTEMLIVDQNQLACMNNIRIPLGDPSPREPAKFVQQLVKDLYLRYHTYLANFEQDGVWYARISAQIYNEIDDYKLVAEALLKIRDQLKSVECDWELMPDEASQS